MQRYKLRAATTADITKLINLFPEGTITKKKLVLFDPLKTDYDFEFDSILSLNELRDACQKIEGAKLMLATLSRVLTFKGS